MSVLIKGMNMPKNCRECPFLHETSICYEFSDCPLVEVKSPHGSLIDADKMVKEYHNGSFDVVKVAKTMPIIIEAEE